MTSIHEEEILPTVEEKLGLPILGIGRTAPKNKHHARFQWQVVAIMGQGQLRQPFFLRAEVSICELLDRIGSRRSVLAFCWHCVEKSDIYSFCNVALPPNRSPPLLRVCKPFVS